MPPAYLARPQRSAGVIGDPKEKALWRWANVQNLDYFLLDVYDYFVGNGIWSILLNRVLSLLLVYRFLYKQGANLFLGQRHLL